MKLKLGGQEIFFYKWDLNSLTDVVERYVHETYLN